MEQIKLMKADIARIEQEGADHPEGGADGGEGPSTKIANAQPLLCHMWSHLPGLYPRADSRRRARGRQRGHSQVRLASFLHFLAPAPSSIPRSWCSHCVRCAGTTM
jgi:hypothetical protein